MLNIHSFINKNNTLISSSYINTGLNPITNLYYGDGFSRFIFSFDESRLKELINDKTLYDTSKIKHYLKIFNAGSLVQSQTNEIYDYQRASSVELVLLKINQNWDEGKGYDYSNDIFYTDSYRSYLPSNWFQANGTENWLEEGILSGNTDSSVVASQYLESGLESVYMDVTEAINSIVISGDTNYGFCLAYKYSYENSSENIPQYIGLFTRYTNTIFKPYIETIYDSTINDDRSNFKLDRTNKLYFYSIIDDLPVNLDYIPSCQIKNNNDEIIFNFDNVTGVTQESKGVYSVEFKLNSKIYEEGTTFYDTWSGIYIDGEAIDDFELHFTTKASDLNFNKQCGTGKNYSFDVYGVNNDEYIMIGEKRKINVIGRIPYTTNQSIALANIEYRIYIKEGNGEITIIDYTKIDKRDNENYFILDSENFVKGTYYLDVRFNTGLTIKHYKDLLRFNIVDNIKNKVI